MAGVPVGYVSYSAGRPRYLAFYAGYMLLGKWARLNIKQIMYYFVQKELNSINVAIPVGIIGVTGTLVLTAIEFTLFGALGAELEGLTLLFGLGGTVVLAGGLYLISQIPGLGDLIPNTTGTFLYNITAAVLDALPFPNLGPQVNPNN